MSRADWQKDIDESLRRENWSLTGQNRIVKVVPLSRGPATGAGGYITLAKYLSRKTPQQLEKDLGLPSGYLASGVQVFSFRRLPMSHEYEYDLTLKFPGGLAYNPAHSDPNYPPGAAHIHQWKIKDGVQIPVDPSKTLSILPGQMIPSQF